MSLPDGCLIAFYGDDFTGSSSVMELLTFAGLPTVLFLKPPTEAEAARFSGYRGIGVASVARARGAQWMDRELPAHFSALGRLGAPINHYKICSTFDSAPHLGSIGKATDLAAPILGGSWHPLLVAAPAIHRYQFFGNLFASVDGAGYRLDRHPTMSAHPATPMDEADVRRHLSRQTSRRIGLVDFLALTSGRGDVALAAERDAGAEIVAIDVVDKASLAAAGKLIWEHRGERLLVIGSQGVEYALLAHWRATGEIGDPPPRRSAEEARTAAVSGSCSPVTGRQIAAAEAGGFEAIRLDVAAAAHEARWPDALDQARDMAMGSLRRGRNPLVYTARGPNDAAIPPLRDAIARTGEDEETVNTRIGVGLGQVLRSLVSDAHIHRVAIAGGDTSGSALAGLGITALHAEVELAPACAISRADADQNELNGLEVALKGGQMGPIDYFAMVAHGRAQQQGAMR